MVNKLRKMLKSEKGFTLVELLAVIVILGIIAAIAVPAIGKVIDNSKKDAHIANAKMIYEAARLYDVSEDFQTTRSTNITLSTLQSKGYIDEGLDAPSGQGYDGTSYVNLTSENIVLYEDNHTNSDTNESLTYIDTSDDDDTVFTLQKDDVDLQE